MPRGQSIYHRKPSPLGASRKTRLFCARPTPFGPPNRQNFLRDGHRRWPTCQASVRTAHATLFPRIGAAVSAAIPGTRSRVKDRCPRPKPSLADPAAPLPPNPLPLQRLGAAESSSSRSVLLKMSTTLSSSAPCAICAINRASTPTTSPRPPRSRR